MNVLTTIIAVGQCFLCFYPNNKKKNVHLVVEDKVYFIVSEAVNIFLFDNKADDESSNKKHFDLYLFDKYHTP